MSLCWGIIGVGKIAHDFYTALNTIFTEGEHCVVAIASRDLQRSKEFAKNHPVKSFYGSYEELAKDDRIEICYIGNLNNLHYDIALMLLNHGKHILCEKPMCMNFWQTKQLLNLAKNKNLFIMEGLWSRFFPAYKQLKELITFGDNAGKNQIKEIYVKHGFRGDQIDRVTMKNLGGGILMDIGVYAIQFVLFVFGCEEPKSIKASGKINQNGVDMQFEAQLLFSGGRVANIICSGLEEYENQATIISKNGPICIPTYWCPTSLVTSDGKIYEWPLPNSVTSMNFTNSLGLRYEADEVQKCLRLGRLSSAIVPPNEMLLIAQIKDEIRKQIGVRYDCD